MVVNIRYLLLITLIEEVENILLLTSNRKERLGGDFHDLLPRAAVEPRSFLAFIVLCSRIILYCVVVWAARVTKKKRIQRQHPR